MALTRQSSSFEYTSSSGGVTYRFVVQSSGGLTSVRNIQGPRGLIQDSLTSLPQAVVVDIQTAVGQVEDTVAVSSSINGTLTFNDATTASVVFATALASTGYRVHVDIPDFIPWRVSARLTTGFTIELAHTYTGTARYDVMV